MKGSIKHIVSALSVVFLLIVPRIGSGQSEEDSVFSYETFIEKVLLDHPAARQATLLEDEAESYLRKARGGFDPVLSSTYDHKQFDDKNYFRVNDNRITIPTILGAEITGGYELNSGEFLNPEQYVPENGLAYTGISLNLGKGLFIDERRRDLALAKNNIQLADANQTLMLNDLILNATNAYWSWVYYWSQEQIFETALEIANQRFIALRENYEQGDIPAIDTLEASIQVQSRDIMLRDAQAQHRKAFFNLSNFLWNGNSKQTEMACCPQPQDTSMDALIDELNTNIDQLIRPRIEARHPAIMAYDQKLDALDIEKRWHIEKLKPKINLKYNIINEPVDGNAFDGYHLNDYKFGFAFEMPLILRKERAELQLVKLKQSNTLYARSQKLAELSNKFESYAYELDALYDQLETVQSNLLLSERLLEAEKIKFNEGESSIFLINSREMQLINYRLKNAEIQTKILKANAGLQWSTGQFNFSSN